MRILFLTPFPPSSERPDALNHPQLLSRRHQVTLVLLHRDQAELSAMNGATGSLHRVCALPLPRMASVLSCASRALTPWPLYLAYYYTGALMQAIRQIAVEERPDVVHAHTLRMAPYALGVDAPLKVCNLQDVLTTRYAGYVRATPTLGWPLDFEEWIKLGRFEPALWRKLDRIGVVSEQEASDAGRMLPGIAPQVIRPGIDVEYFAPLTDGPRAPLIVFLGRFSYRPNVEAALKAALDIFPIVKRRVPSARLTLVGSDPPPRIRQLADRDGVDVTGRVDDVRPYLGRAALSLSPMTVGGGVKYKVLQSLAMGTPVVTNSLGVRGTGLMPGRDVVVAEGDEALANACTDLLLDPEKQRQIGAAGRAVVIQQNAWDVIGESLEAFHRA
jgi:glycosyltransferase involved in cell wall biosynthesis